MSQKPKKLISIRIPPDQLTEIDVLIGERKFLDRTDFISSAIIELLTKTKEGKA